MAKLFQPCDTNAVKSDKYVPHGTAIVRLLPPPIRRALLRMAREDG